MWKRIALLLPLRTEVNEINFSYVISAELLHIHSKKLWEKKKSKTSFIPAGEGETVCTFMNYQGLMPSAMALLSTPRKSHYTSLLPRL